MSTIVAAIVILLGLIVLLSVPIVLILLIVHGRKSPADVRQPPGAPMLQPPTPSLPYARIPRLLSLAEADFFAALQQAAPGGHQIPAQVRLANLIQVKHSARRDKLHWWRIQSKCVDFVLVDKATFAPRLVVELDDASHDRADRRERDAFVDDVLALAGLPILHVRWQRRYDTRALAEQIIGRIGMTAPAPILAPVPAAVPTNSESCARPIPTTPLPTVAATITASRYACGRCQADLRAGAKFCPQSGAVFTIVA
jgi:very-short-patch-repair endonuclease